MCTREKLEMSVIGRRNMCTWEKIEKSDREKLEMTVLEKS